MCRFGFGSSTPKGGVNIWYWTVVLLPDVRWDQTVVHLYLVQ